MKSRLEDGGACRKIIHVEVPAADVAPEYTAVLKEYGKYAQVPGFRQGKAPMKQVEKRYASKIMEETRDRLVPKCCREAMATEKVAPVAVIEVRDVKLDVASDLTFTFVVDVAPDFVLPKYMKIPLVVRKIDVPEADIDKAIDQIRSNQARFGSVTGRVLRRDDLACIDFTGTCNGASLKDLALEQPGLAESKDFWMMVGEPEFLPGFAAGIEGMGIGDHRTVSITFPTDHHVKPLAGHAVSYAVSLKSIKEKILPDINEEFLKRFGVQTDGELREKIRKDMAESAAVTEKNRQKDELVKFLLGNTEIEVPQSIVEEETDLAIRNIVHRISTQGATRRQIEERRDEIVGVATRSSIEKVKLMYLLSRIAAEEKIEVDDTAVEAVIVSLATRQEMPVEEFRKELHKRGGMDRLRSELRAEKTLDFLMDNANINS